MRRPLRQMLQHVVTGQVDQQRRDRYLASGNRVKVRARATVGLGAGGADPVNRSAARIARLQRLLVAFALSCPFPSSDEHSSSLLSLFLISFSLFFFFYFFFFFFFFFFF